MVFMILILGGTTEGRRLVATLNDAHVPYTLSLAGRTSAMKPGPNTRVGGFGGVAGLREYLEREQVSKVIDATHPFARQMHSNAAAACEQAGVPLLRLMRPGWRNHPYAGSWRWVNNHQEALQALKGAGRVLLTIGRQEAVEYAAFPGEMIVRIAEATPEWSASIPESWEVIAERGPFDIDAERALISRVDAVVSKESGGRFNESKLEAAHELGVPMIMIARPTLPPAQECGSVAEAAEWALS